MVQDVTVSFSSLNVSPTKEQNMSDTVTSRKHDDIIRTADQLEASKLLLDESCNGRVEVEWDADAKVTPMGSLVFFAQFLQTGGLMDHLCRDVTTSSELRSS